MIKINQKNMTPILIIYKAKINIKQMVQELRQERKRFFENNVGFIIIYY